MVCFHHEQDFLTPFDLILPAIDRLNRRQDVDTGGKPFIHKGLGDFLGIFFIAAGDIDKQMGA